MQARTLSALSVDAALQARLRRAPARARVHSSFDRTINIDTGGDRLMTLAHRDCDDAPDTIVVDLRSWTSFAIARGTEVALSEHQITLGEGPSIGLEGARPWTGRLSRYPRDRTALLANLPAASDHLERNGRGAWSPRQSGERPSMLERATSQALRRSAVGLCSAIARDDESLAVEHVDRLVGLGPGLTPSGDDFLLGLLCALSIPGSPCHEWRRLGTRVLERASLNTHLISAAALRHAANGRVRARLVALCDALARASRALALNAVDRVIDIGASSGTDIAFGVLSGFRLHLRLDENQAMNPSPFATTGNRHDH